MPEVGTVAAGIPKLRAGDVECPTIADEHLVCVRRAFNVGDDFLDGTVDFTKLAGGGGKGGDLMTRTTDGRFFVKQLNGGDADSLLREDFLRSYVATVTKGTSLLCKLAAVFVHPTLGRFVAMANCLPTYVDRWSGLYDLKGSADDKVLIEDGEPTPEVHKRCWHLGLMVREAAGCTRGTPLDRQRYVAGKKAAYQTPIYVTKEQKQELMSAIDEDVALLKAFGLMDYSMIVGVHRPAPGTAATEMEANSAPGCLHGMAYASQHAGDTTIIYFGIIDFLQEWTGGKKCAHIIKAACAPQPISTIPPPRYAKQFREFFKYKLRDVAHPLPPAYVNLDPGSGSITGLSALKLASEAWCLDRPHVVRPVSNNESRGLVFLFLF